jgi:hypothetical protein
MSRLTGTDAYGLMEAYQAVYAPQELTEEQVLEEVETWVNSLLEEGYDLSDYTWEEMYEAYIEEQPETANLVPSRVTAGGPVSLNKPYPSQLGGKKGVVTYQKSRGVVTRKFRELGSEANPPSAAQARKDEADPRRNLATAGSPPFKPPAAPKPAAPKPAAPKPAAPKPAAPKPAAPKPTDGAERRTPTSAELKNAKQARTSAILDLKTKPEAEKAAVQAGINAGKPKPTPATPNVRDIAARASVANVTAPSPSSTPTPAAPKAPSLQQSIRNRRLNMDLDMFDVIRGHLLDEGYADTEESALVIMANMSEEWRESILSEDPVQDYRDMKRADENRGGARGPELSHNTTTGLKGKPQPGKGFVTQKPTVRGREFTNPPS